jgi:hypothetical protein
MIKTIDYLILHLTSLRTWIIERRERTEFIREHYKDVENAGEFWDKYH